MYSETNKPSQILTDMITMKDIQMNPISALNSP